MRLLSLILLLSLLIFGPSALFAQTELERIQRLIQHADTYYWFGMGESGNVEAYEKGLGYLAEAHMLAEKLEQSAPDQSTELIREISALKQDLQEQLKISYDSFYGFYPIVRLFTGPLLRNRDVLVNFELVDDPKIMALREGINNLANAVIQEWISNPQLDVAFLSQPSAPDLENEALYIFNTSPKFFVHSFREINLALTSKEVETYQSGEITPTIKNKLCQTFGISRILIVSATQLDIIDKDYFYLAEGRIYSLAEDAPVYSFFNMGFSRDRRKQLLNILISHLLSFLLSLGVLFLVESRRSQIDTKDIGRKVLWVVVAITFGRLAPWFVIPALDRIRPEPNMLALYASWWPILVGLITICLPIFMYRVASSRLFTVVGTGISEDIAYTIVGLGGAAYFSVPIFLFLQSTGWLAITPVILIGGLSGFILGRAFSENRISIQLILFSLLATSALGVMVSYGNPIPLWGLLLLIMIFVGVTESGWFKAAESESETDMELAIFSSDSQLSSEFQRGDLRDIIQLIQRLVKKSDPLSEYLFNVLDDDDQRSLVEDQQSQEGVTITAPPLSAQIVLVNLLNAQLENPDLYTGDRFKEIQLSAYASDLIEKASSVELRNRQLLLEAFHSELKDPATRVIPKDIESLKRCCAQPSYIYSKNYHQALQLLKPVLPGQSTFLTMLGPSGMGKTATTNALIETIQFETQLSGQEFVLLSGKCPQPFAGNNADQDAPYAPFQEALSKVFNINLLAPADAQLEQLDAALDGIFDSAVPYASLLFPSSEESFNTAGSNKELFVSIERTLKQLLETDRRTSKVVLVFIDDIQWIDESSRELLEHLVTAFRDESETSIAFLLTSREKEVALDVGLSADEIYQVSHEVGEESRRDHISILSDSLNLTPPIAESIVDKVGDINNHQGALYWLCQVVTDLTHMGAFQLKEGWFSWTPDFEQYQNPEIALPVPSELRDSIIEQLEKHTEYLSILECAACLGLHFPASILATSLGVQRLRLLKQLAEIEQTTNFIYDVKEEDDIYSFRSSIVLEVIRERIQIIGRGPRSSDVPQIVREYHTRVAEALIERPNVDIFAVAKHFYAAGSSSATDGMKYCLQAAQAAVQQPAVNEAREYIKMAKECANVAGLDEDGQDFITLECHLAHISGEHRAEMAQKCMDYLEVETNPTPEFLMIVARSCYDGAMDQRDQNLFAKAAELGEQLTNHPQAKPTDQADGFHFIGLSLPPTEADQRKQNLSRAFDLLINFDTEDISAQALLARVANSFALQLEREDPAEASRLYQQSIDIKNRPELRDINGLAISHNGLGRIHIFGQPPNPAQARYHFEMSLEFAERIGSAIGICKSSSFLGMCAKTEEKYDDAVEYYQRSYDYAQGSFDRGFAAAGLLESLCNVQDLERMNEFGPLFLAQITTDGEVPGPTISAITGALDRCQEHSSADWLTELRSIIPETEA